MAQFNYIEVTPNPCQSFVIGNYRVRLNFNYLFNFWSYSLYNQDELVVAGVRLMTGDNIFKRFDDVDNLTAIDTVGRVKSDWYDRLTKKNRNGLPDTVLVYGSANP